MITVHAGGRPRDTGAAPALLRAARDLVARHGYRDVTIQMIAEAAGVGRQTLYRRWPSKADLVLEAYLARADMVSQIADGPVAQMLEAFLRQIFEGLEEDGPAIRSLIAAAQDDEAFRATFHERFVAPRDRVVVAVLQRGIAQGALAADADLALLAEMVHGVFWYRLLVGKPLDAAFARQVTAMVLAAAS